MEEKKKRIEELVKLLNEASYAYYNDMDEIMSNYEWDAGIDELSKLEHETGYIMENSPTQNVGADEDIASGEKEPHEFPMLSLAKTKNVADIQKWAKDKPILVSWKLDGLTLVATYDNGKLTKLMTRGKNGIIGTNITYLADFIKYIPKTIKEKGHMVVRGEAVISYSDFERFNATMEEDVQYKNPRNLVSGTLGLDVKRANEVRERGVQYIGFRLVYCEKNINSWRDRINYLLELGFTPVEYQLTDATNLPEVIQAWTEKLKSGVFDIPVDGLVATFEDNEYAESGPSTGHHKINEGMAFKWPDTPAETTLDHIEWSCAANSISPVAVFDPVELEGTTVKRASLCNISEMERLGIGADRKTKLTVIKANMIIPKIIKAGSDSKFSIPEHCPVCESPTKVRINLKTKTKTLHCTNNACPAKHIKALERFVSKDGVNIDGLSIKSITKFINMKFIKDAYDIFFLDAYKEKIIEMEGFGSKSYDNMIKSIKYAVENADYYHFIYSLSIPMIGLDAAKRILNGIGSANFEKRLKNRDSFEDIEGIGPEKSNAIINWYEQNFILYEKIRDVLKLKEICPQTKSGKCNGMTFVITGDVHIYKNRNEFKEYVESQGGKVAGSVSKKTTYLVNNDIESDSSKNKKAKELEINIITEEEFTKKFC